MTGVGTSGPFMNRHSTCDAVTSPRPPGLIASSGRSRDGTNSMSRMNDRRRDDAVAAVVVGVEAVRPPQLAAGRRIVAGDDVAAGDRRSRWRRRSAAAPASCTRRATRMRARVGRSTRHIVRPSRLADAQQIGRIVGRHAVQHLHVERVLEQQRRRAVAPVQPEAAVVLLDVARPDLPAVEVERLEDARCRSSPRRCVPSVTGDGDDMFCFMHPDVAAAEALLPAHRAVGPVEAPEDTGCRPRRRSGRSGRPRRSASSPTTPASASFHAMFSVLDQRTGRFVSAAEAVQQRSAPLRPVLGRERRRRRRRRRHTTR